MRRSEPLMPARRIMILAGLLLLGTAPPTLAQTTFEQQVLSSDVLSYGRQIGDLDGDGLGDVLGIDDTTLHWYRAPSFSRQTLLDLETGAHGWPLFRADDLRLADMDGDGDPDAVTRIGDIGNVNGTVVWLENPRTDGDVDAEWTLHPLGAAQYVKDIVVADFDGDGAADVAAREHTETHLWLNDGDGFWSERVLPHHSNEGLDAGDLDGDGDPDLVLNGFWLETPAAPRTGAFTEHEVDDRWYSGQSGTWQINSSKVVAADVDRNGTVDVVLSHSELPGYPVSWYSASDPKNGPWVEHVITPSYDLCHTLQVADFDLDGHQDVLAGAMADSDDRGLTLFLGDRGAAWIAHPIQALGSYSAEIGDLDADGDLDVVDVRNHDQTPTEIRRNDAERPVSAGVPPGRHLQVHAHPNPFNPSTLIRFELKRTGLAAVRILDSRGHVVRRLAAAVMASGDHALRWNGRDDRGRAAAAGAYRVVVTQGDDHAVLGLTLLR